MVVCSRSAVVCVPFGSTQTVSYTLFFLVGGIYVDACKGCIHRMHTHASAPASIDFNKILDIFKDKNCQLRYIKLIIILYFVIVLCTP